ncbi:MAG: ComEA family DNA-binding protein [Armatimonadota bacterium]
MATEPRQGRVRLNHAGLEELQRIPGVGPELAKSILTYRYVHGPFRSFSDLDEVPGIGPGMIEQMRVSATLR